MYVNLGFLVVLVVSREKKYGTILQSSFEIAPNLWRREKKKKKEREKKGSIAYFIVEVQQLEMAFCNVDSTSHESGEHSTCTDATLMQSDMPRCVHGGEGMHRTPGPTPTAPGPPR